MDTLQHISLIMAKRQRLADLQVEAEEQLLHRVVSEYVAGRVTRYDLVDVYDAYRAAAGSGSTKRWLAALNLNPQTLRADRERLPRIYPTRPDGTWRGDYPLRPELVTPVWGVSVVYVLYDDRNEPCYVGSTENFKSRLGTHQRDGKQYSTWIAHPCEDREAAYQMEDRLLKQYKPYLNRKASR